MSDNYIAPVWAKGVAVTPMFGCSLCDLCSHRRWPPHAPGDACAVRPDMLPNVHSCRAFVPMPGAESW